MQFEESDKLPFLDILLIISEFHLLFSVYRKPTHSDRYLNFHSCHPISVKQGVVIALVDRAFRICFREFLDSELLYLWDVLFCISYPIKFIDKKNRRTKHNNRVIGDSECTELDLPKRFISLPYVPTWGRCLKEFWVNITLILVSNQ